MNSKFGLHQFQHSGGGLLLKWTYIMDGDHNSWFLFHVLQIRWLGVSFSYNSRINNCPELVYFVK